MAGHGAENEFALNLGLSEQHLTKNPGFANLLRDLGKRLLALESTKALEIKAAEEKHKKVKSDYFEQLLFYTALLEIFIKSAAKDAKSFLPEDQLIRDVHLRLACAETSCFLEACGKECSSQDFFLGLQSELSVQDKPNYNHEDIKTALVSKIEKWLSEKEASVLQCYFQKDKNPVSSCSRLSSTLEKDVRMSRFDCQKLKSEKLANQRLMSRYSEVLLHATSLLIKILETINLELRVNYEQAVVDGMVSKSQTLKLKAESILLQIQKETYTPEATAALKCIRSQLNEKQDITHKKILDMSSSLGAYEKLGKTFEELADEVRVLNQNIELQKWTYNKFSET